MKLLVTGAGGFVGREVVAAALARGHEVRALARPRSDMSALPWANDARVEIVRGDLRSRNGLADVIRGVDAVLHLAAAKAGDFYDQFGATVVGTENLLHAMEEAGAGHIVLVSSFAVYDYCKMRQGSVLNEDSPLDPGRAGRDDYSQTKLLQEQLVRQWCDKRGWRWTVLRPGVIFGKDNLWTARLGAEVGKSWIVRTGANAKLPLTYVENCAEAVVLAAERQEAAGQVLNVVDDETPTQREYLDLVLETRESAATVVAVNWTLMKWTARFLQGVNVRLFGGRAKLPGILRPAALEARCKPLRYSNERIKKVLGWQPRYALNEALKRSRGQRNEMVVSQNEATCASGT